MFHRKIDETFKELLNVLGIADDHFYYRTMMTMVQTMTDDYAGKSTHVEKENLKPNKGKCLFRYNSLPFFGGNYFYAWGTI